MPKKPDATVLAFDFGTRRIGVAMGNTLTRVAHSLTTIDAPPTAARFTAIAALIDEWQPATEWILGRFAEGRPRA